MQDSHKHGHHENHSQHQMSSSESKQPVEAQSELAQQHSQHEGHSQQQMGQNHDDHNHAGHGVDHGGHETMFRNRFWVSLVLSIPVLLYSEMIQDWFNFTMPEFPGSMLIVPIFSVIVFAYGGIPFLQMALPEIQSRKPGMMLLISLAISVAFAYSLFAAFTASSMGFFWEMVTLIDVMLLGHWMEMRSVRQASGALNELAKLLPDTAEVIQADGTVKLVAVSELKTDDLMLVRPGASIPSDGQIAEGQSTINEAMITGESKPVDKAQGDEVIGGTINGDGSLRVRVTAIGENTAIAGIMRLVEEAQKSKSATQILADKAAGWLFYIAIIAAAITAIAWTVAVGFKLEVLERVVTVLVIACPHALGLAIPLVVAISTSMGAKNGILVRNRLALEEARLIDIVIFDKTGTLTEGRFGIVDMVNAEAWDKKQVLGLALGLEGDSEHPIAHGFRQKAEDDGVKAESIADFEALKGRGIKGTWSGKTVYLGGPRLLEMLNPEMPTQVKAFAEQANENAQTVIYLIIETSIAGAFALADVTRKESKAAIQNLHDLGIQVAMLTGDSNAVAQAVGRELKIDTIFAEVLPEHKDQKVAELQKLGKRVAMVGDGVNDAPALTRANIGIAIGSGTDVAIESADIILVNSNPQDVVKIFQLSRATYRKMIENLLWATGYNVFAIPLAAGLLAPIGFVLSPAIGAALMSLSTVVVAINAQLLRQTKLSASG
jgi:P-type Cu2+ transporter